MQSMQLPPGALPLLLFFAAIQDLALGRGLYRYYYGHYYWQKQSWKSSDAPYPFKACTLKVGYIGGVPEEDPYRRGFDFWVDFANASRGTDFSEGVWDYGLSSDPQGYLEQPHCIGIEAYPVIASSSESEARAQVDELHSLGVQLVIIGMRNLLTYEYRKRLSEHFINNFAVNVVDWVDFRLTAFDFTWGVGHSHLDLGTNFATLTARESKEGICLLLPPFKSSTAIDVDSTFELVGREALMKAVNTSTELGLEVLLEVEHDFYAVEDMNRTVEFLGDFARRVVGSGCDVLMAFVGDNVRAALLQTELVAANAPLIAEFFLPEMSESHWASLGTLGEHVYTAAPWHPTVNFKCPVFGNTRNFVTLYEEWEEEKYGVARPPGVEEASTVAAGVLILVAQRDPRFFRAEDIDEWQDVAEEEWLGYRLMKVFEGIQVTTFYGDVHFDGRGQNIALIPLTLQYFEGGVKYAVRPKGATTRAAALPMDSFESRENPEESLPGCPPGTKLVPRFDDKWTLQGKRCERCEPMQYQDEYNQTECKACPEGEVSGLGDSACAKCSPGYFRADTECHKCNWGEFTDSHGATECDRCPAGRFASSVGQSACEDCPAGHIAPEPGGQRECQPCPNGFSTGGANGSALCEACDGGSYANGTGSPLCSRCPESFGTEQIASDSRDKCVCPPGSYWHRETINSQPMCQTRHCDTALICDGWSNEPPRVAEGFSAGVQFFEGAEPSYLVRCGSVGQCPSGSELGECPLGHKDERACADCKEGYSKSRTGACVKCDSMPAHVPVVGFLAAAGLVAVVLYGLGKQEINVESESVGKVTATAGILLTSLQILAVFRYIAVDWPEPITTIHNSLSLLLQPAELLNLGCIYSMKGFDSYAMVMLMWPVILILVLLLLKTSGCLFSSSGRSVSNNTIFQIECMLILVFYTSISMHSLIPWQCEDNPDSTASVVAYRQVLCWDSTEHTGMVLLSCVAVLIFVMGFLSLIAWATYLYPIQVTLHNGVSFLVRYRWIFNRFKPERYYHGLIYSTRNLVVTLLPVIFANNMPLQFLLVGTTLLASLMLQCWLKPWKTELANKFDAVCTTLLVLMLVVGGLLLSPDEEDVKRIVRVFFSLSFALIGLAFFLVVVYNVHLRLTNRKRFAIFLCHHKVGAAVLARWLKIELKLRCKGWEVFLDSDELSRLDTLFEIVAFQTQNFVVLLTKETLKRIWCAGEITTALKHNLNIIRIACNDYEEPTDEFIEGLEAVWTDTQISEVARQGVSLVQIKDAFRRFRELPKITLDRGAAYHEQARLIEELGSKSSGVVTGAWRSRTERWDPAWSQQLSASETALTGPPAGKDGRLSSKNSAVSWAEGGIDNEPTSLPLPPTTTQTVPQQGPSAEEMRETVAEIGRTSARISTTSVVVQLPSAKPEGEGLTEKKKMVSRVFTLIQHVDSKPVIKSMKTHVLTGRAPTRATNLMVGYLADPEAAMVCRVIQLQLQQALQTGIPLCSRHIPEAVEQIQNQNPLCLIAVLTRGVLSRLEFAVTVVKACALSPRPTLVPIVADYAFAFPDSNFYTELEDGEVLDQQGLESHGCHLSEVGEAYKALFTIISKRFSSHGSEKIQLTEVQEMTSVLSDFSFTKRGAGHTKSNGGESEALDVAKGWSERNDLLAISA